MGSKKLSKSAQKVIQERSSSKKVPGHDPRGSRRPKRGPRETQERPGEAQKAKKSVKKSAKRDPKSAHEDPKSQVGAKMAPRTHQKAEKHRNSPKQSKRNMKHAKLPPEIFQNRTPKGLQN